jgi:hypothetical protein
MLVYNKHLLINMNGINIKITISLSFPYKIRNVIKIHFVTPDKYGNARKNNFCPHTTVFVANGFICPLSKIINSVRSKKVQTHEDSSLP